MNSLVSVIIPVYNVEPYLRKCIESVINQTYTNLEVILVDDGSPDKCPQICDEFASNDSRIIVIHKKNEGQGVARNVALDMCHGEYISFIDSDDYILPDMIETMVAAMMATDSDISICGLSPDNGICIRKGYLPEKIKVYESSYELIKDYLTTKYIFAGPCNKIYKRTIFDGIRFPNIRAREDAYIMHELLGRAKRAVHVAKCLYVQYIRPDSTEQKEFNENKMMLLQCSERLQTYISQNFPQLWDYIKYKHMNEIAVLMEDIVRSFSLRKNRSTYNMLLKELGKEVLKYKNETDPVYLKYKDVFDHNGKFIFKSKILGVKRKVKGTIKKAIVKVKGGAR